MIRPADFLNQIIRPTLAHLEEINPRLNTIAAQQLLLGTAMVESNLEHVRQLGNGPALSPFQIEPNTMWDMYERFLARRPELFKAVSDLLWEPDKNPLDQLQLNMRFACAIARIKYWSSPLPLARPGNWAGHAKTWKQIYNTHLGAGLPEQFLSRSQSIQDFW